MFDRRFSPIVRVALFTLSVISCVEKVHAQSLTWDLRHFPTTPLVGNGNWDTTTSLDWSNGSTDLAWVNGDSAIINTNLNGTTNQTLNIDDPSGTLDVSGFDLNISASGNGPVDNVTVTANPGDSLTLTNPNILATATGTVTGIPLFNMNISAPVAGTLGIDDTNTYVTHVELDGQNAYTGPTTGNFGLGNGASLSNTAISGVYLQVLGGATAGTTGPGTSGATLAVNRLDIGDVSPSIAGQLTLNQEQGFNGTALTLNGTQFEFFAADNGVGQLDLSGPGTVEVLNPGTPELIGLDPFEASYLTPGTYTLIDSPIGGLDNATWTYGGPTSFTASDASTYYFSISHTDNLLQLTIAGPTGMPEPTSLGLMAVGVGLLMRRRPV